MAWYEGIYSCGHDGRVNVIGPGKDRQWKIDREFSGLCPECYKKEQAEKRANANAEAAKKSAEMELPELTGTEKQIAWANTLRVSFIERINKIINEISDEDAKRGVLIRNSSEKIVVKIDMIRDSLYHALQSKTDAKFWIDSRKLGDEEIFFRFVTDYKEYKAEEEIPEEIKTEIEEEKMNTTVSPECEEKKIGVSIIEFDSENSILRARYIKDSDFIGVVKSFGYEWNGTAWNKKITEFTGSADDRAAELGNKLLSSGFTVQFPNMESKDMAISGAFSPENERWVKYHVNDKQLAIVWKKRSDTLYDAAKKLPGARWKDGSMRVKVEFYREVEDFADTMGFSISQLAKGKIEEYKQKEKSFETVLAKAVENENIDDSDRIRRSMVLSGGIIEDLIDE